MTDEQALITRLEAANTEELARLILFASTDEEKVLRIYLGDTRFRRLRNLVLRREMMRRERGVKRKANTNETRNVVIIPGILGSELTSVDREQKQERLWLSPHQIAAGHLDRLQLEANGLTEVNPDYTIRVTGIMKRYYGELMLGLAEHWNVQAFWYDWRKDFRLAAAQLQASIDSWFPAGAPVHLVAHAAGGLVARAYIQQFPQRWKLGDSKLIMIGVPNRGLYTAPQAITGHLGMIQWIDLLDAYHDRNDFRALIKSFPSLYQLLPAPELEPKLYEAATFGSLLNVSQDHLNNARAFHALLQQMAVDPKRMAYIAGDRQQTFVGVRVEKLKEFKNGQAQDEEDARYLRATYPVGPDGDGTVPHALGIRFQEGGAALPAYCMEALHGDLCSHPKVLMALNQLLEIGKDKALDEPAVIRQIAYVSGLQPLLPQPNGPSKPNAAPPPPNGQAQAAAKDSISRMETQKKIFSDLVRRVNVRSDEPATRHLISVEEREVGERLTHGFLSGNMEQSHAAYQTIPLAKPTIKINLVQGDITDNHLDVPGAQQPIDALAFGHYSGSKPYGIMRTLDVKISRALEGQAISDQDSNPDEEISTIPAHDADLLLTQYTQRGTIRSDLAQTFFLVDPRDSARVIAIAGMGEPGRFGVPELTVMVRELCWALGRMGKRHLVTTLIGTGRDNLAIAEAVAAWLRGIKLAISGLASSEKAAARALQEITFFITDPRKLIAFDEALLKEQAALAKLNRMTVTYTKLAEKRKKELRAEAIQYVRRQMEWQQKLLLESDKADEPAPTRITVSIEGHTYRFGAITDRASIPEREIPLDPALVQCANDELAAESDLYRQLELGQFMQRLLIPADLRSQLTTAAPLVMMLDSTTARVHWELLAQADAINPSGQDDDEVEPSMRFLGISRGFTRQLRTRFAPLPEPPPPPQRHLRVLVVADPAADAHLPGAEEEGIAVADLFERFNIVHAHSGNRVEVVRLFGPHDATRTNVLRHLMMRTYDVLHFAGHCIYDANNPTASGWIFSNGERLSAYEFTRIDRSPAFVFSNACESGITPARSDERSVDLAPSFAEAFFARGVTNFVCTAWPVEDRAARDFALTLYAGLLGLAINPKTEQTPDANGLTYKKEVPLPMYAAMRQARMAIALPTSGVRTWGAYQHYGNPYFRFFDPAGMRERREPTEMKHENKDSPSQNAKGAQAKDNTVIQAPSPTPPPSPISKAAPTPNQAGLDQLSTSVITGKESLMSKYYALLIGVDFYYPGQLPGGGYYPILGGCVRDISHVEAYLTQRLQLPPEQILKLTATASTPSQPVEQPEQLPTYENMVAQFKKLTELAQRGDSVYIHYSGHGGRTTTIYPALKGADGIDEALVPTDIHRTNARYLRDVELYYLLQAMLDKGLIVTIVLDSCHSGGATRGLGGAVARGIAKIDTTQRPTESLVASTADLVANWQGAAGGAARSVKPASGWLLEPKGYTLFAACRANESAYEYAFDGRERNGALTYWLLDSLRQAGPDFSYQMLQERILAKVHTLFDQQTPQLQGEGNRAIFGSELIDPHYAVNVMSVQGDQVQLAAGAVHGLQVGAQFAVYRYGAANIGGETDKVATVEVKQVNDVSSSAMIVERIGNQPIEQGAQAVLLNNLNVRLQRNVAVAIQDAALHKQVEAAIAANGKGFIKVAGPGDQIDFQVAVTQDVYELWDPAGKAIPNLRPALRVQDGNALDRLVGRLVHLAKYRSIQELTVTNPNAQKMLQVELIGATNMDGAAPIFRPGEAAKLKITNLQPPNPMNLNDPARVFNICVLDLGSDWSISQVYPIGSAFEILNPSQSIEQEFTADVLDGYTQNTDLLKVFATQTTTDFRWLELPALEQPDTRSMTRAVITDPLEQMLANFTVESSTRIVRFTNMPQAQSWATAQVELVVKA